jgi:hypothetical protein
MRGGARLVLLFLLGAIVGGGCAWILLQRASLRSAQNGMLSERLAAVAQAILLLDLLDADRNKALRTVIERDLSVNLEAADDLARAGAHPPFYPAFTGEFLEALKKTDLYIRAHHLNPTLVDRAHRLRSALGEPKTSK